MLVLSRRETQRIKLGKSIIVTVVRVTGDKVRLGIEAPPDVLIPREELDPHQTSGAIDEEETLTAGQMDPLAAVAARSA